ncbi:MAG: hypothetical protein RIQ53_387, partial [Pseudomonadota bacterium]
MSTQSITISVSYLGTNGLPSLFDVVVSSESTLNPTYPASGTLYDAWCLDTRISINVPGTYVADTYSPYDRSVLASELPNLGNPGGFADNLDSINWLLGYYSANSASVGYGNMQAAIWTLMGQDWHVGAAYLGTTDQTVIDGLVSNALAQDGYVAQAGDTIGVVLDPTNVNGVQQQTLLITTKAAAIGDRVWEDTDADGVQDAGEAGIAGATVELVRDVNGDGVISAAEVLQTAVTDAAGNYLFNGLAPGVAYQVRFTLPSGYDALSPTDAGGDDATDSDGLLSGVLVLAPGATNSTVDGGFYKYAQLGDRVWLDADRDGTQDAGEAGLANVTVNLLDANGAVVATTTTDASGNYHFTGLVPSTYSVQFVKPAGYDFTTADAGADSTDSDASATTGNTAAIVLRSGDNVTDIDAGLVTATAPTAHIGDRVFEDLDGDGIQDAGEAGLGGVTVSLRNSSGIVVATTTTDASGNYGFDVAAGTYSVQVTAPAGYVLTARDQGGDDTLDSDVSPTTGRSNSFSVVAGQSKTDVDAGLYRLANLGDQVFVDTNGNGQQDAGETGIWGVTVQLLDASGNVVDERLTDVNGNYLFTDLAPGTYSVKFVPPAGYTFTQQDVGADVSDSDADASGQTAAFALTSGQDKFDLDAGLLSPTPTTGTVTGTVLLDTNNDNVGDTAAPGVTVVLRDPSGAVVQTTVTGADGSYTFTNVVPGNYTVTETNPVGVLDVADKDGGDLNSIPVTVSAGQTSGGNFFVDEKVATLGDKVWLDADADGQQDAGEAGVADVTVELLDAAGTVIATTTTDASGNYLFDNLAPGSYSVKFVTPTGYTLTTANVGADASDSDANPSTGITGTYTLNAGDVNLSADAGLVAAPTSGTVTGTVLLDSDNDNVGDTPAPGVTVQLRDPAGNVVATTTTGADGSYTFPNVPAGSYTVTEVNPAGVLDVVDSDGGNPNSVAVTVTPGQTTSGVVFVDEKVAKLGDKVWLDSDADGQQDAGEAGVANVTVQLLNAAGTVVATTLTDASGNYLFDTLAPGSYSVKFVAPAGYTLTTANSGADATDSDANATTGLTGSYTLNAGDDNRTVDAGLLPSNGSISGKVLEDSNNDNTGDTPIAGVTVVLKDAAGATIATTTTGADGSYSFGGLAGGNYSVTEQTPAGFTDVSDKDGGDLNTIAVTLPVGGSSAGNDFVDERPGSITGTVLLDSNNDNVGDTPAPGVTLTLKDAAGNTVATTTTGADGSYTFTGVPAGQYTVTETDPAGTLDVADKDGGNLDVIAVTVTGGQTNAGNFFVDEKVAKLGDRVWLDADADGQQDAGEANVANVTVQLLNSAGTVVATTATDTNGNYLFDGLAPGTYSVKFVTPTGYTLTTANVGADASDSDANQSTGITGTYTLNAGDDNRTVDAGLVALPTTGTVSGTVLLDSNNDDVGDTPAAGVVVQLRNPAGTVVASTTTGADGSYTFTNVAPGNYTVTEVNPAGVLDVADKDGGDLNNIAVTVVAGQASTGNVFVDEKAAKLGDKVWLDADADGQQDAGEAGVANVTVQLLNAAGTVLATTTTDAAGNYLFDNLAPGAYTVKFVTPTGYTLTTANVGADATDSDANATTGLTGTYTLNAGDANLTADAGLVALPTSGAVTGKVLLDSNNDNVGDTPAAGVTVQLRNAAGTVVATTTTGADGSYAFTGVAPGSYTVTEVNPAGVLDVADKDGGNLNSIAVTVVAGQTSTGNDFVDEKVAKIGDKVWVDANGNGVQDTGEVGLAGATVTLRDSAGNAVATTTTDASGVYGFDVAPGSYSVQVTAPTGYVFTGKDSGSNDAVDSDVDATTGRSATVSVNAGDVVSSLDAGLYKKASLGDKVWFDTDGDGQQDAGEAGAAGVTVQLLNAAGTVVATQLTNASGNYLFSDLAPGSYSVKFVAPSGYKFTTANSGADATDSDVDGTTGTTGSYTLASGDARTDVDAGLKVCLVKIGDKVWLDADKDGVQDAGEAGVAGVTVKLVGAGTDGVLGTSDDTVRTTTTDASGNYSFADVAHGSYRVQLVVPSSYALTTANVGTNDAVDSDFVKSTVLGTTNLIINGSFEATQTAGYYSSFSGWCAVNDKIELNKATAYGVNGASGNMVVELDANACVTGGLYQEVKTAAGQTYELSVDLAQRAGYSASTNTVEIYWAGTKIATIDPSSTTLTTYTFSVTGTGGNDRLTFKETSNDDDSIGGIIDNVKLVTKDTVVQTDVTVNTCADNLTIDAGLTSARDIGVDIEKYVSTVRTSTSTTGGTEGATCSYWKSATTFNWYSWSYEFTGTGCKTGSTFNSIFGTSDSSYGNYTLAQCLAFTETSGKKALMREAVAAYLNASHGSVDYEYSKDQVCQQVKYCFTSGSYDSSFSSFKYENEQGCNWSTSKTTSTSVVDTQLYDADAPPGLDVTTGSTVVFTYKVTNTGDAALKNVTVTDDRIQSISYVSGDINCNGLLDVGETWTYTARETASSGTIKNVGTVTATDTVDGATKVTDSDAAYYTGAASTAKGAIGDRVWADTDCDGVQDSTEKGVAGVTVKLKGAGTDGVFGTTDDIAASTVTDANGRYQFSGLAAGKYQVEFTAANATFTGQNKGTNDACDSDVDANGSTGVITLAAGEQNLTVDAGLVTTGKAAVGNLVWQDANHNNVYDAGECGIEGVTVRLYSASTGAVVATCKTDDDGKY